MTQQIARTALALALLGFLLVIAGCGSDSVNDQDGVIQSAVPRDTSPNVPADDLAALVEGNSRFAFDLYQKVAAENDNLFYSPYSISLAFTMVYAGARSNTAQQMAETLHFDLESARLHPALNALDLALAGRGGGGSQGEGFSLEIANAIWGQKGYPFQMPFLDILAENYGAGMRVVDFAREPDACRLKINDWVAEETQDKIRDILPPGSIEPLTRFVLANAIYFRAAWAYPFAPEVTRDGPFRLLDGGQVTVPMMNQMAWLGYAEGEDYQAVELPYEGHELSMVILLPLEGQFETFDAALDADRVSAILSGIVDEEVQLTLPRFRIETSFSLRDMLSELGMADAFVLLAADFSGINGGAEPLCISVALHKAFVAVDEKGTEAAAATVIGGVGSCPQDPPVVTVDRPFILLIRDIATGAILFVGRVVNPGV